MRSFLVPTVLVGGIFVSNAALFMAIAVLALFMSEIGLSQTQVGMVLGLAALTGSLLGVLGAQVARWTSEATAVAAGSLAAGLSYLALAHSSTFGLLLLLAAALGVARSIAEPAMKALLGRYAVPGRPDLLFRLRYLAICGGAIVGPACSIAFESKRQVLQAAGASLIIYAAACAVAARWAPRAHREAAQGGSHAIALRLPAPALADPRLLRLIAAGGTVFLVFSLFESLVPLALQASGLDRFSTLLILNASLGIALQVPVAWAGRRVSTRTCAIAGCCCFALAYVLFAHAGPQLAWWYAGVVVFTCGEVLTLPAGEILIDRVAPDAHKAQYFGLAELRQLGFFAGPALGGFVLQNAGQRALFLVAASVIACAAVLYRGADQGLERSRAGEESTSPPGERVEEAGGAGTPTPS